MKKLQKEYGPDVTEWKWGDYHQLALHIQFQNHLVC